jgi:hypothetical protein
MSFENAVFLCIGIITLYWFVALRIEDRKQTHYWRGRHDGFEMHRRMTQNKTDQVFDYDNYK